MTAMVFDANSVLFSALIIREAFMMERKTSLKQDETPEAAKHVAMNSSRHFLSLIYDAPVVDMTSLRKACSNGVPEGRGIRSITWKLMLNLLPPERSKWKEVLTRKRDRYRSFCEDLIVNPQTTTNGFLDNPLNGGSPEPLRRRESIVLDVTGNDHPLALDASSKWNVFFKDNEIREQIDRDVMRTHPDMHFFSGDGEFAEKHRAELKRALFVFAKLNPGLTYVQGMNEIYAPLYYVFKTGEHGQFGELNGTGSSDHAESDAFFCFIELMGEFRDNFCKQLDDSTSGIKANITRFSNMLVSFNPKLWSHLKYNAKVDFHYFAFRWITLLLTQEFVFPDVLRLWDSLTAAPPLARLDLLLRICVAMLEIVKEELIEGDYTQNLKLLQKFPGADINHLINLASIITDNTSHS
eukprot:g4951.t1